MLVKCDKLAFAKHNRIGPILRKWIIIRCLELLLSEFFVTAGKWIAWRGVFVSYTAKSDVQFKFSNNLALK